MEDKTMPDFEMPYFVDGGVIKAILRIQQQENRLQGNKM
jgi:hypothetical protein